jgi:diguanylate cyclase (GGDEF)-like protein
MMVAQRDVTGAGTGAAQGPGESGPVFRAAPLPADEDRRQRTLDAYGILDTGRDARFEELVAEVADVFGSPIATITFVDRARQWFKASVGLPFEQTDRDVAFCAHTILDADHVLVVEDTARDERFADNPLVLGDPHLMAYAGAPIVAPDGTVLGTVCAMDYRPRDFTPQQLAVLQRVAMQVVELLDAASAAQRLVGTGATTPVPDALDTLGAGEDGRDGSSDEVLALTRPLIEAIGEDVDIVELLGAFCTEVMQTFGWWAARVAWVQGDALRPDAWLIAPDAPPVLAGLAGSMSTPVALDGLEVHYVDPAVHDIGMLRWVGDRDVVAGIGGRHAVVLDVPGATSLAARILFLLPSSRAFGAASVRTLTTAAAVLPRVFVQDRARRELTYRATHDMLTGLLNREGLDRRYDGVVSGRAGDRAVLYIDLDSFKTINDAHGHRAGDEVLARVARQIGGRIRPTDTAARIGGDEFLVVLDGILHEDEAMRVARRLLNALCGTYTVFHTERVQMAVSIGVALWGADQTLETVIDAADRLMYAAKELGGSAIATDGHEGRRLLGIDDRDDRDLDAALSGAIQVVVAPVRDLAGSFRAIRVAIGAEVRHPDVADLVEVTLQGVVPLLDAADEGRPVQLLIAPSGVLWATDGLILRTIVALAMALPQVEFRLLVTVEDGTDTVVRQASSIRDTLGVGIVIAGFGSDRGDLGLFDRLAPVALELDPEIIARRVGTGEPSSALVAARALADRRGLVMIVPGPQVPVDEELARPDTLVVDLAAAIVRRREALQGERAAADGPGARP